MPPSEPEAPPATPVGTPGAALTTRAVRGATSLAIRTGFFIVLSLVRVAIVARLLGPAELGLFGVLTIVAEAARALTTSGAGAVLVQEEHLTDAKISTYWTFIAIQSAIGAAIVAVGTPFSVEPALRHRAFGLGLLVALSVLMPGLANPGRVLAEREARFERVTLVESIAATAEIVIVLGVALWLRSAIALAAGALGRAAIEVVLSFALFPLSPRPGIERESARKYLHASGHFFAISAGAYVMIYGDNLAIATRLGAEALGLYVAAHRMTELAFSALFGVTNRVVFPVLSRVHGEKDRFLRAVLLLMETQLLYLAGIVGGFLVLAPFLVAVVYGSKFTGAAVVLQALVVVTIGRSISRMIGPIMLAVGRYDFESKVKGIEAGVFVIGVFIGVSTGGLVGVALGAGAGYLVAASLRLNFLRTSVGVPGKTLGRMLLTSAGLSVMAAAISLAVRHSHVASGVTAGWLQAITYAASYAVLVFVLRRPVVDATVRLVKQGMSSG